MKKILFFIFSCLTSVPGFSQTLVVMVKPQVTGKWGFVNAYGETLIPPTFGRCNSFSSDGFAPVYDSRSKVYFFVNLKGERLASPYHFALLDHFNVTIEGFTNGLAPAQLGEKWGYIGTKGMIIVPAIYDATYKFSEGFGIAKRDDRFFVIDDRGTSSLIEEAGIREVRSFSEGLAPYVDAHNLFGFINPKGKTAIKCIFDKVGYFSDSLAWAKARHGKIGFINHNGDWVIKPQFNAARNFDHESGLARVNVDGEWAYVNTHGKIISMHNTSLYGDFSEGLAMGRRDLEIGFFDKTGTWIIPPQFEGARDFKNGYAAVKLMGRWGVLKKDGSWAIRPSFASIKDVELVP